MGLKTSEIVIDERAIIKSGKAVFAPDDKYYNSYYISCKAREKRWADGASAVFFYLRKDGLWYPLTGGQDGYYKGRKEAQEVRAKALGQ